MALGALFHRNLVLGASLSGGQWTGLDNLKTVRLLSEPASCSAPADPAASQFLIDFGRRELLSGVILTATTIPRQGTLRFVAGETPTVAGDGTVSMAEVTFDSGTIDAFQRLYATASLAWEDPNFWDGKPDDALLDRYGRQVIKVFDQLVSTRYLAVYLDTLGGAELDLGHLFCARAFVPEWNYAWGRRLTREDRTQTDVTPGGVRLHQEQPGWRSASVTWPALSEAEAGALYDVWTRNGRVRPVVFVPDSEDLKQIFREAFLANIMSHSSRENSDQTGEWTVTLELQEVIG